ncbi:hypothetical protein UK23_44655, partial [Lentzea aerocolonigenes]
LTRLLSLMTALSPGRRPSARECADALLASDPPTRVETVRRRPRGLLAVASAAVLVAAVGTGLVVQNRATPVESAPPAPTTTQPQTVQQTAAQTGQQTPVPVVEQPAAVQPPVQQENNSGKGKPGKGKGNGKGKGP